MSLIVALMLMQGTPDAGPSDADLEQVQEITVIAQKLRQTSVRVDRDPAGKYQCNLSESTGLLSLDAELCKSVTTCGRQGKDQPDDVRVCVDKARPSLTSRIRELLIAQRVRGFA